MSDYATELLPAVAAASSLQRCNPEKAVHYIDAVSGSCECGAQPNATGLLQFVVEAELAAALERRERRQEQRVRARVEFLRRAGVRRVVVSETPERSWGS